MIKIFFISILFLFSCKNKKEIAEKVSFPQRTDYDFKNPQLFKLPNSLREISGLDYEQGFIYTHNDEQGIIFKIDPNTGTIIDKIRFGKNGDYEGIEVDNNEAILVQSNGDLSFYNFKNQQLSIKKNKLKTKNNIEGLFLKNANELLIACKGEALHGNSKNKEKTIYSYNLKEDKINKTPFLEVSDKQIEKQLNKKFDHAEFSKKKKKKFKNRGIEFSPSGIAIHPKSKEIYIISARGSTLLIFSALKKLKEIIFLNQQQLPKPEGICFDENLNLYISTEFNGGIGKIYKYTAN